VKYDSELKAIFKHYSELAEFKIHKSIKSLDIKGYSVFVKDYNISPELHKMPDCLKIYKYMLRDNNVNEGLSYDQFLEILLRLAAKSDKLSGLKNSDQEETAGNEFDHGDTESFNPHIVESNNNYYLELFKHMKLETRRYTK
jgi:hypothetical protein